MVTFFSTFLPIHYISSACSQKALSSTRIFQPSGSHRSLRTTRSRMKAHPRSTLAG